MESVVDYWKPNCSWSSALHHCPIQSDRSSECQGGGYISQSSTPYNIGVGSVCESGHKVKVSTLYSCNIVAVKTSPNGVCTSEFNICVVQNEWLNNPLQKKPLCNSAGVSHCLPRTDTSHTHTGVQDNSSCSGGRTKIQSGGGAGIIGCEAAVYQREASACKGQKLGGFSPLAPQFHCPWVAAHTKQRGCIACITRLYMHILM